MDVRVAMVSPAFADADPTMDQIYTAAAGGHLDQAQEMISKVPADHPTSAKAHYVQAESMPKRARPPRASELGTCGTIETRSAFCQPALGARTESAAWS